MYSDFAICSCGGILQICQWYRVCDAGALRAEPLATLHILRGQKKENGRAAMSRSSFSERCLGNRRVSRPSLTVLRLSINQSIVAAAARLEHDADVW